MALNVLEDDQRTADVKEHLTALADWNAKTGGATSLEKVGEETRRHLSRAVVDPRPEAYTAARTGIIKWMQAALTSDAIEGNPESRAERELALEAYRAVRTGAPAMIALNLRQGTPKAAIDSLEEAGLSRALPPGIQALIRETSGENAADAWLELFRQVESLREQGGTETSLPHYMAGGAALWAAIGLYRSSPGAVTEAMPLAMTLVEFGMPEVRPHSFLRTATRRPNRKLFPGPFLLFFKVCLNSQEPISSSLLVAATRKRQSFWSLRKRRAFVTEPRARAYPDGSARNATRSRRARTASPSE